jgi:hypothetical protein
MRSHSNIPLVTLGPVLWVTGLGVAAGLALTGCSGAAATSGSAAASSGAAHRERAGHSEHAGCGRGLRYRDQHADRGRSRAVGLSPGDVDADGGARPAQRRAVRRPDRVADQVQVPGPRREPCPEQGRNSYPGPGPDQEAPEASLDPAADRRTVPGPDPGSDYRTGPCPVTDQGPLSHGAAPRKERSGGSAGPEPGRGQLRATLVKWFGEPRTLLRLRPYTSHGFFEHDARRCPLLLGSCMGVDVRFSERGFLTLA